VAREAGASRCRPGAPLRAAQAGDDAQIDEGGATPMAFGPGGRCFGSPHAIRRYEIAFYAPFVSDWSNFGQWTEEGAKSATERANRLWKRTLAELAPPPLDSARREALDDFIARRAAEGGAPPES
jgi:trimethylamine--corrinoid protein Co-methyltransferase